MFDTLFWAFYWVDVLSTLDDALFFGSTIGAVGAFIYVAVHDHDKHVPQAATIRRGILRAGLPVLLAFLMVNMIPAKDTMYMMLATRVTDHAVSSETGQKLLRALNNQLDKYIEKLDPPKKEK